MTPSVETILADIRKSISESMALEIMMLPPVPIYNINLTFRFDPGFDLEKNAIESITKVSIDNLVKSEFNNGRISKRGYIVVLKVKDNKKDIEYENFPTIIRELGISATFLERSTHYSGTYESYVFKNRDDINLIRLSYNGVFVSAETISKVYNKANKNAL